MSFEEHMDCPECGGTMELDDEKIMLVCPFCGNRESLDSVTASRLNSIDAKATEIARIKAEEAKRARKKDNSQNRGKIFKRIVGVFVALIFLSVAVTVVEDLSYDYEQKNRLKTEYEWPATGLAQLIPQPQETKGHIPYNSSDNFEIEVPANEEQYLAYIEAVKQAGFTVDNDISKSDTRYEAYDVNGNHICIYLWKYNDPVSMDIELKAPMVMRDIVWPTSGVGAKLPVPASTMGSVQDTATNFRAVVGNTTPEGFVAYVNACLAAGFDNNYSRQDFMFYGNNSAGDRVRVEYIGFNQIEINIYSKND